VEAWLTATFDDGNLNDHATEIETLRFQAHTPFDDKTRQASPLCHIMYPTAFRMASVAGKVAQKAGQAAANAPGTKDSVLKKGAKRDPELYVRSESESCGLAHG
jgi:hypothetical protein